MKQHVIRTALALVGLVTVLPGVAADAQPIRYGDAEVQRVLDDYIGLYRKETLERWKALFLPGFVASYTNDDRSVTSRNLDEFYQRQLAAFAGGPVSETLHNVRTQRVGNLAHVFADFRFTGRGATRPGQLMLLMIKEKAEFRIAALTFTYHLS